jgi:hypothetical protein
MYQRPAKTGHYWISGRNTEHTASMNGTYGDWDGAGESSVASPDSVLLHLDVAACATCAARTVVADIALGRAPILTCLTCGRTSASKDGELPTRPR